METYLRDFERTLRLDPEETRAIVAEVRGNLEDLILHLKGQGYAAEEAEREALRRFDDAEGLAHALRRAHRRAPLALQLLALLLVAMGIAGLIMAFDVLLAAVTVIHTAASVSNTTTLINALSPVAEKIVSILPWRLYAVQNLVALLLVLLPPLVILTGALVSLWAAKAVVLGQRRQRGRRVGVWMGVAILCDLVLALSLLSTLPGAPSRAAGVPAGRQLAAAGLCFRPAANQPTRPVVVDRLCADRTGTFVQYQIPDPTLGEPSPALFDGRVQSFYSDPTYPQVSCRPCSGYSSGSGSSQGLRELMPWHGGEQGLAQFAPLDAHIHDLALVFNLYSQSMEVVHIPVNLRAWNHVGGGTHPFIVTSAHGLRVNLTRVIRGVSGTILDYTIDASPALVPRGTYMANVQATLTGAHGHIYEQLPSAFGDGCRQVARGGGHCAPETLFTLAPRGERLTLTVKGFAVYVSAAPGPGGRSVLGSWRVPFVMP